MRYRRVSIIAGATAALIAGLAPGAVQASPYLRADSAACGQYGQPSCPPPGGGGEGGGGGDHQVAVSAGVGVTAGPASVNGGATVTVQSKAKNKKKKAKHARKHSRHHTPKHRSASTHLFGAGKGKHGSGPSSHRDADGDYDHDAGDSKLAVVASKRPIVSKGSIPAAGISLVVVALIAALLMTGGLVLRLARRASRRRRTGPPAPA
jgi:hypothetical protein